MNKQNNNNKQETIILQIPFYLRDDFRRDMPSMTTTATAASSHIMSSQPVTWSWSESGKMRTDSSFSQESTFETLHVSGVQVYLSKVTRDVTIMSFVHTLMS